ncbi:MAG: adenosylcobinamide-GDP ribazoletransferase, partial [Rhodospirillales bacterium]|nr:adenosylcobinamide-GDP ribazoletransferase [Rhodospirillales bacterium]
MSERSSEISPGWIADLHFALAFLTRLPLPPLGLLPEGALAHAMRAFPLAGALLGLLAGGVFLAAAPLLTPLPAGVLA